MESDKSERATEILRELKRLDAEWDRLDSQGTQTFRQGQITDQMVRLQAEYKLLTGNDADI